MDPVIDHRLAFYQQMSLLQAMHAPAPQSPHCPVCKSMGRVSVILDNGMKATKFRHYDFCPHAQVEW
jgi:hypothetical protein